MLARRKQRLDDLAEELGDRATAVCCDVTDLSSLEARVNEVADLLGGLDGVVAVAGRMMAGGITSGSPERWRELIDLNLVGPLATVRYATARFSESGRRDVVIVGSTGALTPMPGVGIYAASKRGLEAAFDSLRLELAQHNINVSLVMPGMFETEGLTWEGVIIDGEVPITDAPMFVEGTGPATARIAGRLHHLHNEPARGDLRQRVGRSPHRSAQSLTDRVRISAKPGAVDARDWCS